MEYESLHWGKFMREIVSTVTSKGQVTIPAEIRRLLSLQTHDKLVFVIDADGFVRLRAPQFKSASEISGIGGQLDQPLSWHEMRDIVREERAEEFRRENR